MSCFAEDIPSPPAAASNVGAAAADSAVATAVAASLRAYLDDRLSAPPARREDTTPGLVRVAGALLGALPLPEALSLVYDAMLIPPGLRDLDYRYVPLVAELSAFGEAVNRARAAVTAYAVRCLVARRGIVLSWIQRALLVVPGSDEWSQAMSEVNVVVVETTHAEQRWRVFEDGVEAAVGQAHAAVVAGDWELLARLTGEVDAAGVRHSRPSAVSAVECE